MDYTDWVAAMSDAQMDHQLLAERRRYALLHAAAILLAAREPKLHEITDAIFDAQALLAEIERREHLPAK
jgi:hypothetical protein